MTYYLIDSTNGRPVPSYDVIGYNEQGDEISRERYYKLWVARLALNNFKAPGVETIDCC